MDSSGVTVPPTRGEVDVSQTKGSQAGEVLLQAINIPPEVSGCPCSCESPCLLRDVADGRE